jgi:L-ribulose-5-phosphate 4-epimerase
VSDALERAVTLEEVARMALLSTVINAGVQPIAHTVVDRHFSRKHGPGAYYGQPG